MPAALSTTEIMAAKNADFRAKIRGGWLARATDYVIRQVAPGWARQRQQARTYLALGDGYDVSRGGPGQRERHYTSGDADSHVDQRTLVYMRELARDAERNCPMIDGLLTRFTDNVLGPNWNVSPNTGDKKLDKDISQYISERFDTRIDISRRYDMQQLTRLWLRAVVRDGDILRISTADGIQTIEGERISQPAAGIGDNIVNGIKLDRYGRHLGYYLDSQLTPSKYFKTFAETPNFIPASPSTHFAAHTQRYSQTRGLGVLTSALKRWSGLDGYIDNEQVAAQVSSALAYFVKRANAAFYINPDTGQPFDHVVKEMLDNGTVAMMEKMMPGTIMTGAIGDEVEMLNPARPGNTFEPYIVTVMRMIGCAIGMPLELVLLDFSRTNYSSARASLLQAYRSFRNWQQYSVKQLIRPHYQEEISAAVASRYFPANESIFKARYLLPQWAWIDPYKEVVAAREGIRLGIDTISDYVQREGQTLDEIIQIKADELEKFRENNVPTSADLSDSRFAA